MPAPPEPPAAAETLRHAFDRLADRFDRTITPLVPVGPVALLDFPHHANVGDSAIWVGERRWLGRHRDRPLAYAASADTFSAAALRAAMPSGTVLIHGGGNFGDLWPEHQDHRERVLAALSGYRIVQLPQSIWFETAAAADRARRAIAAHPDVTVVVRSEQSREWAERHLDCAVVLAPDPAVMLPRYRVAAAERQAIVLRRGDHEGATWPDVNGLVAEDWLADAAWMRRRLVRALGWRTFGHAGLRGLLAIRAMDRFAAARLRRGLRQLARGEVVLTDRLHAAILGLRIDRPIIVVDNRYGKARAVLDPMFGPTPMLRYIGADDNASDAVRQMAPATAARGMSAATLP